MKKISILALVGMMVLMLVFSASSVLAQATTKTLSTNYTVQNLSTTDTASVEVSYMKAYDGTTAGGAWTAAPENTSFTVAPGASKVVAQYLDAVMSDGAGSATVSADQPIAAIVNQLARGQTPTSGGYTGFSAGGESFYMPFAFKNLVTSVGIINSQLIIMNVGSTPTNVSVQLINGTTGVVDHTKAINNLPGGESFYYDQALETVLADGWFGSAFVSADPGGSIAAVGNQFTGANGLLTYPGFGEGFTEWSIPLYVARLANGYNSVIAIQNVSGGTIASGGIDVVFTPDAATGQSTFTVTLGSDLANNGTWTVNPRQNASFPTDSYGAAKIVADANVVAIVNQLDNETSATTSDSALSFNAIRADLTGQTVVAPLIMSRLPNGYSTVFTVANLTNSAGTCDFDYVGDVGYGSSDVTVTGVTLPAGGSIVHNHRLDGTGTHEIPADWYGAARVSCTQPAAGMVNSLQAGGGGDPDTSYNAFTVD